MYDITQVDKYLMGAAQQYATDPSFAAEHTTPDNKSHAGIDSSGGHRPAPWLPVVRYSERFKTHVVISSQTPVAIATHKDTGEQWLVPAGLGLDDADLAYTAEDVRLGIKNAAGQDVTVGMKVKDSFTTKVVVSAFVGIVNYDVFKHAGGDGINPALLSHYNYNPQPNVSFNMDYAYCYPLVKDATEYAKAPLKGIAAFVGKDVLAGQFVTYNKDSQFVVADAGFGFGTTKPEHIVGQIQRVDVVKDPDSGEVKKTFNHLNLVNNGSVYNKDPLNVMPGVRNEGMTTQMTYANAYGLVHFSLQSR